MVKDIFDNTIEGIFMEVSIIESKESGQLKKGKRDEIIKKHRFPGGVMIRQFFQNRAIITNGTILIPAKA